MERVRRCVIAGFVVGLLLAGLSVTTHPAKAQSAVPAMRLYVMDGGSIIIVQPERFGLTREQVKNANMSCPVYLVVHPRGTLLFDTGLGDRYAGRPFNESMLGDPATPGPMQSYVLVTKTVRSQLEAIGYPLSKINYLAMSHPHVDHIGNANDFAGSTFLVHKADYDLMFGPNVRVNPNYTALQNSKNKIIDNEADYDVFGDGSVVLISTPGHTPGHQSLYLKLPKTGDVVVSGDLWHYPEDRALNAMPEREKGPGVTEASRKKIEAFLAKTGAHLWISHDINFFSKQKQAPEYYD